MSYGFSLNLFTALATIGAGYALASRPGNWLTQTRLRSIMSVGAGFLISLIFFELLPISMRMAADNSNFVFQSLFLGVAVIFVVDRWVTPHITFFDKKHEDDGCAHHHDYEHDHGHDHANITGPQPEHAHAACGHAILGHGAACSAIGCLIVCSLFDGIAFSAAANHDPSLGMMIFFGQVLHVIPEGLLVSGLVLAADGLPKSAKKAAIVTGVFFFIGAMIPYIAQSSPGMSNIQKFFLPFSAGVLLYVSLGQLLPATGTSKKDSILVLVGGLVFVLLHSVLGHIH